jgi:hypothetical protein
MPGQGPGSRRGNGLVTRTSDLGTVALPSVITDTGGAFTVPGSPPTADTYTCNASLLAAGGTAVATATTHAVQVTGKR